MIGTLGVPQFHYAVDRNILASAPGWLAVERPRDLRRCAIGLASRLSIPVRNDLAFYFAEPFFPRVDLLHTFNAVCRTRVPWICTFETSLPRYRHDRLASTYRRGLELLLQSSCRALIAFSNATRHLAALDWASRLNSRDTDMLLGKTTVLHPPQPVLSTFEEKCPEGRVRFVFIGRDFYRKGGLETLEALYRLKSRGQRDWEATIVGDIDSFGDYASRTGPADRDRARWLLDAMAGNVTHQRLLSAAESLAALRRADFYILPTLADTYGYSVLEAQAHAAICVTTNVRALPELVTTETGFCVPLPLDEARNAHTLPGFKIARQSLVDSLACTLSECAVMPRSLMRQKADAATRQLRVQHAPEAHRATLDALYRRTLGLPFDPAPGRSTNRPSW